MILKECATEIGKELAERRRVQAQQDASDLEAFNRAAGITDDYDDSGHRESQEQRDRYLAAVERQAQPERNDRPPVPSSAVDAQLVQEITQRDQLRLVAAVFPRAPQKAEANREFGGVRGRLLRLFPGLTYRLCSLRS